MKKGILAIAMLLVLVLAVGSAMAYDLTDGVASVSTYEDLMHAITRTDEPVNLIKVIGSMKLKGNVQTDVPIDIVGSSITFDGAGYTIEPANNFTDVNHGQYNVVQVYRASNVLIKDLTIKGKKITDDLNPANTKNVLNIFESKNVVLRNLTLDHSEPLKGSDVTVNNSSVSVEETIKFITGNDTWDAVNVGPGKNPDAAYAVAPHLTFEENADIIFQNDGNKAFADLGTENGVTGIITLNGKMNMEKRPDGKYDLHLHKYVNGLCICGDKLPVSYSTPRTGDESQLMLWTALAVLSAGTMVLLSRKKQQAR